MGINILGLIYTLDNYDMLIVIMLTLLIVQYIMLSWAILLITVIPITLLFPTFACSHKLFSQITRHFKDQKINCMP